MGSRGKESGALAVASTTLIFVEFFLSLIFFSVAKYTSSFSPNKPNPINFGSINLLRELSGHGIDRDLLAGILAAIAIVVAIAARQSSGQKRYVKVEKEFSFISTLLGGALIGAGVVYVLSWIVGALIAGEGRVEGVGLPGPSIFFQKALFLAILLTLFYSMFKVAAISGVGVCENSGDPMGRMVREIEFLVDRGVKKYSLQAWSSEVSGVSKGIFWVVIAWFACLMVVVFPVLYRNYFACVGVGPYSDFMSNVHICSESERGNLKSELYFVGAFLINRYHLPLRVVLPLVIIPICFALGRYLHVEGPVKTWRGGVKKILLLAALLSCSGTMFMGMVAYKTGTAIAIFYPTLIVASYFLLASCDFCRMLKKFSCNNLEEKSLKEPPVLLGCTSKAAAWRVAVANVWGRLLDFFAMISGVRGAALLMLIFVKIWADDISFNNDGAVRFLALFSGGYFIFVAARVIAVAIGYWLGLKPL
ncbi:hypothetical protein ACUH92_05150 [Dermabacteraceae bacterium CCM 9520]